MRLLAQAGRELQFPVQHSNCLMHREIITDVPSTNGGQSGGTIKGLANAALGGAAHLHFGLALLWPVVRHMCLSTWPSPRCLTLISHSPMRQELRRFNLSAASAPGCFDWVGAGWACGEKQGRSCSPALASHTRAWMPSLHPTATCAQRARPRTAALTRPPQRQGGDGAPQRHTKNARM